MGASILALDPTSRLILRTVLQHGPSSRSDVAERTGLSTGSLTRLTRPLLEHGILREGAPHIGSMGRPSVPLELLDGAAAFVGFKLIPGKIYGVVSGLTGAVHDSRVATADTSDPDETAVALAEIIDGWDAAKETSGVGVALAGAVDPFGTVRGADLLGWAETSFSRKITEATGLACTTANDVDALTLAQHWMGIGKGTENFVTLTIGAGVGAGVVLGGQLLVGHQGFSTLIGGLHSSTGVTFHQALSTEGVENQLTRRPLGDVQQEVVERAAELIDIAKHIWGPQRLLLTGEGVALIKDRVDELQAAVETRGREGFDRLELFVQELEFLDWAKGAAALAIRHALRP